MPKLIVLYPPPNDRATFEHRYRFEHGPMVLEKIPGLQKFVVASLQAALASPGGQTTVAHAMEISTGGPPVVLIAEDDQA